MKRICVQLCVVTMIILGITSIFTFNYAQSIPEDKRYLGQTPPNNFPKIFNLAVTTGLRPVERIAIAADGKEIYYSELNTWPATDMRIKYYKYSNNNWQGPINLFEGFVAPGLADNDNTMYMQKDVNNKPCTFYSTRTSTGWSVPVMLISTSNQVHYYQKTKLDNYYLSSDPVGNSDICTQVINNSVPQFQSLGKPINTADTENDFFIANDESYIIFIRFDNNNASDLYISFKNNNGGWTNPKKFNNSINTGNPNWECCPYVTSDNKYLFFTRGGNTMNTYYTYWVKIDNLINDLKLTNYAPYLKNAVPDQSGIINEYFSYSIADSIFTDDDGNGTLSFAAKNNNDAPLPSWLSFDPATKTLKGTPLNTGLYYVKIIATDDKGVSVSSNTITISIKTVTGVDQESVNIPDNYNLEQNFPNPFNPSTSIKYLLPHSTNVKLCVYDTLGNIIKTLVDGNQTAGKHEVKFEANSLASGTYFYQIVTSDYMTAKKFLLLK